VVSPAIERRSTAATFAVLATSVLAYSMLQSLVTPVLPTLQHAYGTSQTTVTWLLTANLLSASVFTPILGRIGDKAGKKKLLLVAMAALALGALLGALAPNIFVLIIARVIQGIGGGVLPLVFGIIRDEFPKEKVSGAVGLAAALTAAGGGLGIVLAGPIVDSLDYHWLFWIPMIVVSIAAVAAAIVIPESTVRTPGPISVVGGFLLAGWLVCLLLAVSEGSQWGWGSVKTLGLIAVSIVIAIIWYRSESKSKAPLIDMQMMRLSAVWTTNLVALLFGAGMYAAFAFLPGFVQADRAQVGYGFNASVTESGFFLLPLTIFMFLFGTVSSRLAERFGAKAVLLWAAAISALGYGMLAFAHSEKWEVFTGSAIVGIALGLGFAAMSSLIVVAVPPAQTGVASGMNANIRTLGGSIGSAVTATIVTAGAVAGLPKEAGYTHGYAVLAGFGVLATLSVLLIPAKRNATRVHVEMAHAEMALVAGGTLFGNESE
jgi:EmrB/QacA subfamily drug resistance transporter